MKRELESLFSYARQVSRTFNEDQAASLPEPVKRYFKYALKENQPYISYVRLKHGGQFRPSKKWASIKGEEYFTVDPPGFVWFGKIGLISGRDSFLDGLGTMKIRLLSVIRLVDAKGEVFNRGELVRWLSETPWFPTDLLPSKYVKWLPIDDGSAKVLLSLTDYDLTVEGTFFIDEKGRIAKFEAKRNDGGKLRDWICQYTDYREIEGMHIPFLGEASWDSDSEQAKYAKFRIEEIDYEHPSEYGVP